MMDVSRDNYFSTTGLY